MMMVAEGQNPHVILWCSVGPDMVDICGTVADDTPHRGYPVTLLVYESLTHSDNLLDA